METGRSDKRLYFQSGHDERLGDGVLLASSQDGTIGCIQALFLSLSFVAGLGFGGFAGL